MGKNNNERQLSPNQKKLVRELEQVTSSGHDVSTTYRDWLWSAKTALSHLPQLARNVGEAALMKRGQITPAELHDCAKQLDTDEEAERFQYLAKRYTSKQLTHFGNALGILIASTPTESLYEASAPHPDMDMVGDIYENWSYPNSWKGQFSRR